VTDKEGCRLEGYGGTFSRLFRVDSWVVVNEMPLHLWLQKVLISSVQSERNGPMNVLIYGLVHRIVAVDSFDIIVQGSID
jgi:hypothetical protein